MYYIYGISGPSLLIESTDSMIKRLLLSRNYNIMLSNSSVNFIIIIIYYDNYFYYTTILSAFRQHIQLVHKLH